jgi:T5orf172 domain.
MAKGIIYLMTTAVPGLVKIGKTGSKNYEQRMYDLEHNGYRNVTALKRAFAIEVNDYDEKEKLLHTIFEKSQLSDTELFAIDVNIAIQLLSSFEGDMIYPLSETKDEIFDEAADSGKSKLIPNGIYKLKRKKKSDNKMVCATATVQNGFWTLLKGSELGVKEDIGVSKKARKTRDDMPLDSRGKLLEDYELGECAPSFAGDVVMNGSVDGWTEWKNSAGKPVDIYRIKETEE